MAHAARIAPIVKEQLRAVADLAGATAAKRYACPLAKPPLVPYTPVVFRRFFTFVLCACLALQGAGLALAGQASCPMESDMEAAVQAGDLDVDELPECCNDTQAWADTGHLCKPVLDCTGLVFWAPAPSLLAVGVTAPAAPVARLTATALSVLPAVPWRPPAVA